MASKQVNESKTANNTNACATSNPRNWAHFKNVDEALLDNIKLFYVFGKHGSSALFTTHDGNVYGLGRNESCFLGVSGDDCAFDPKLWFRRNKISPSFIKFVSGDRHVVALTEDGKVFSWGYVWNGQLGCAELQLPSQIDGALREQSVVSIACGSEHSAAVTERGELYVWGLVYSDTQGSKRIVKSPQLVKFEGYDEQQPKLTSVVCGSTSTHVIADDGCVYSFGLNNFKQLGIPKALTSSCTLMSVVLPTHALSTHMIPSLGCGISQIACGPSHCLAVNRGGGVYSWGRSDKGQLGRKEIVNFGVGDPGRVPGIGRVAEVAAVHNCHLSAARTHDGHVYVWGLGIHGPKLTTFKTLQEAFSHYTLPNITYQTMVCSSKNVVAFF